MNRISAVLLIALAVSAYAADEPTKLMNRCMCNVMVIDGPAGKDMVENAFKNDLEIKMCDDKHMQMCKDFCEKTEKEKTNGDLSVESKISKKIYGDMLCERLGTDMMKKSLKMMAKVACTDQTMKEMDTGVQYNDVLTCKGGKYIKS